MAGSPRFAAVVALLLCEACLNHTSFGVADLAGSSMQSRITYLLADGVDAADVTVSLRQSDGTPARGVTVTASCESCAIAQAPGPTDANGQAIVVVRSEVAGPRTVRATAKRGAFAQALPVTLPLMFYAPTTNGNVVAGQATDLQVLARGATASGAAFSGTMHFTSTDSRALLPPAQTLTPDEHGHRIIPGGVTFVTAGEQTVTAVDAASQQVVFTQTFAVAPGALQAFALTGLPTQVVAGIAHTVQVRPQDAYGNALTRYAGTVAFESSDHRAQLPNDYQFTAADAGEHAFDGFALVLAGLQTVTIEDANNNTSATTFQSQVSPGALAALDVACAGIVAGIPCSGALQAHDAYGNLVTDFAGTVALSSNDPNAAFPASLAMHASDGGETPLSLTAALATGCYVQASTTLPPITTKSYLHVAPGPLDHLAFMGLGAHVMAGEPVMVQLQAQDLFDNVNAAYRGIVSLASTDAQASLSANTLSFSGADAGQLPVPIVFKTTGVQQLQATDVVTGLSVQAHTTVLSGNTVQALAIRGMPTQVTAGVAVTGLTLQAVDVYGNPESNYAGTVAFTSSDSLAGAVAPVTFTTLDAGIASVPGSVVLRGAGTQTITFADTMTPSLRASQTVTVVPAAAVATKFLNAPTSQTACMPFGQPVTVAGSDAYNNTVPLQAPAHIALQDNSGASTPALLLGPTVANPNQGLATFNGLRIAQAGNAYRLVASAANLSAATSANFVVAQTAPSVTIDQVNGSAGAVRVVFDIQTACPANLTLTWSPNASGGWSEATLLPGSASRRTTTASGNTFIWDSVHDLPATTLPGATLRLTAEANGLGSTAQSAAFNLNNGPHWGTTSVLAQAGGPQACMAHADLHALGWDDIVTCDAVNQRINIFTAQGNAMFAGPQSLALGGAPAGVTIVDFDRNGMLDLLVPIPALDIVSIFLASAPGVFSSAVSADLGTNPQAVRVADINADGNYDLVATQGSAQKLAWALGGGGGGVAAYSTSPVGRGARDLVLAPMDRDAWLDAVVLNRTDATVSVLPGTAGGYLASLAPVAVGPNPQAMMATDINRDGLHDVVVVCSNEVDVLLGAVGGLQPARVFALGAAADAMAIEDINQDGTRDVLVGTTAANKAWGVLFGDGTGALTTPTLDVAAPAGLGGVLTYDMDHDGRPDLVGVSSAGALYAASNATAQTGGRGLTTVSIDILTTSPDLLVVDDFNGDGKKDVIGLSLSDQLYTFMAGDGAGHLMDYPSVRTQGTPADIKAADFNGDGAPDFAISSTTDDRVAIYLNHGDANFTLSVSSYLGGSAGALSASDLNQDGKVDLAVVVAARNGVIPLLGDGNGVFVPGPLVTTDYQPVGIVVGDVNNDGLADLVTANAAFTTISSMLGDAPGAFGAPVITPNRCAATMILGDADHDGLLDVFTNCFGNAGASGGDGTGAFPHILAYVGGGWGEYTLTVGDINHDGWLDWAYPAAGLDQVFGPPQSLTYVRSPFSSRAEVLADMDDDGWEDLVIGDSYAITVVPNERGSMYGTQLTGWPAGADAIFVDINRDGIDDALTTTFGNAGNTPPQIQRLAAYLGDGAGRFAYAYDVAAATQSYGNNGRFAHGDFNHDGWPDVLLTDQSNSLLNVWMNTGDGNVEAAQSYSVTTPYDVVTADIDRDGDLDVVIASVSNGVYTIANDGTGAFASPAQVFACNHTGFLAYGDLDADGAGDIFSACFNDDLKVTWMTSTGAAVSTLTINVPGAGVQDVAMADLDADGRLDLIFDYINGYGGVGIALGAGSRTFAAPTLYPMPASARMRAGPVAVDDFNADGLLDVMTTASPKGVALYAASSPGVLGAPQFFSTGVYNPERILAADVNRDGRLDAVMPCNGFNIGYNVVLGK